MCFPLLSFVVVIVVREPLGTLVHQALSELT